MQRASRQHREDPFIFVLIGLLLLFVLVVPFTGLDDFLGHAFKPPGSTSTGTTGTTMGGSSQAGVQQQELPPRADDIPPWKPVTPGSLYSLGFFSTFAAKDSLLALGNTHVKIEFSQPVSTQHLYSKDFYHNKALRLLHNYVYVDTQDIRFQHLDGVPVTLTFYHVDYFPGKSKIVHYTSPTTFEPCTTCKLLSSNENEIRFSAPEGLSGYGIQNPSPPQQQEVILSATTPYYTTTDTLTCTAVGLSDPDSTVIPIYRFSVNSAPYEFLMHAFEVNSSALLTPLVFDFSPIGIHGILGDGKPGTAPQWVSLEQASVGGAYYFDGVDDVINLFINNFPLLPTLTFEGWVNLSSNSKYSVLFGAGTSEAGYSLGTNDGQGNVYFALRMSEAPEDFFIATAPASLLTLNEMHYIAGVYAGEVRTLSLYVDGVLVNVTEASPFAPHPVVGVSMGADYGGDVLGLGNPGYLHGVVDQMYIYLRALSAEQIAEYAQKHYNVIVPQETNIGELWRCSSLPTDGYYAIGANVSTTYTITSNQIPVVDKTILNSSSGLNITTDDYTCLLEGTDHEEQPLLPFVHFDINDNLTNVLYLPFETGTNSSLVPDFGSYHFPVSGFGVTSYEDGGLHDGAYYFDDADYVVVPDDATLDFSQDFTLDMWVGLTSMEDMTILSKGDVGSGPGYGLFVDGQDSRVVFTLSDADSSLDLSSPVDSLVLDVYTHIVVTVDRDGVASLYLNGQLAASKPVLDGGGQMLGSSANNQPLFIGKDSSSTFYHGFLDELLLYNYVLTPEQVSAHTQLNYALLDDTHVQKGDVLSCVGSVHDGFMTSPDSSPAYLTVLNSLPTQVAPTLLTPAVAGNETFKCLAQNVQDLDGDTVTKLYSYYINEQQLDLLYLPFEMQYDADTSTLDLSLLSDASVFGASLSPDGKIGSAYHFDGVDDYISVSSDVIETTELDLDFWASFDSSSPYQSLAYGGSLNPADDLLYYGLYTGDSLSTLEFAFMTNQANTSLYVVEDVNLTVGAYAHFAVLKRTDEEPMIFVNGELLIGECVEGDCTDDPYLTGEPLYLGKGLHEGNITFFKGYLDEFRVASYYLTPGQIALRAAGDYTSLSTELTYPDDTIVCAVSLNDDEEYGETMYSTSYTIPSDGDYSQEDSSGSSFIWNVNEEDTVTYTMINSEELVIVNLTNKVKYLVTLATVDNYESKSTIDIYPNVGAVIVKNDTSFVDVDLDNDYDISIYGEDFAYELATLTFSLFSNTTSTYTYADTQTNYTLPGLPGTTTVTSTGGPPVYPYLEEPRSLPAPSSQETLNIPHKGLIVGTLLTLIAVTMFVLFRRVKGTPKKKKEEDEY